MPPIHQPLPNSKTLAPNRCRWDIINSSSMKICAVLFSSDTRKLLAINLVIPPLGWVDIKFLMFSFLNDFRILICCLDHRSSGIYLISSDQIYMIWTNLKVLSTHDLFCWLEHLELVLIFVWSLMEVSCNWTCVFLWITLLWWELWGNPFFICFS